MRLRSLSCPPSLRGNNVRPPAGAPQLRAPLACSRSSNTSAEEEESYDSGSEFTGESTDSDGPNIDDLISPNINATVALVLERRFEQAMPLMSPSAGQLWFLI